MDWEAQEPERGEEGFTGMEGEADAEAPGHSQQRRSGPTFCQGQVSLVATRVPVQNF